MKTRKNTKKVAKAPAQAKNNDYTVNIEYVEKIADEACATIMALRALVRTLVDELEDRK